MPAAKPDSDSLICMAEIVGVHGIKGLVKLKCFGDDPEALAGYSPLCDAEEKRAFTLLELIPHGNIWLARIEGVDDRTPAEKLRGVKLYVSRARLPDLKKKDTYYHADLVGLSALWPDGREMGRVLSVANFGATDLLEIKPPRGNSFYVPFTKTVVPDVNLASKTVTVDPPPGLLD
jgi:16S rRNA processing protein RimM